jgi:hypothetical protein
LKSQQQQKLWRTQTMNKLYSLILMLFVGIAALAADRPRSGRITITSYDDAEIRVEIDGRRYYNNDNTIRISNINSGYHSIQVYRRQWSNSIFGGSRERLVYSSNVYVRPDHRIDILIERNGRAQVRETDLGRKRDRRDRRDRRDDDWDDRRDDGRWEDYEQWERNNRQSRDNDWDRTNRPGRDNDWDRNDDRWRNGYGRAVSNESFQSMKQTLRRENFENTRLTLARQMMERNSFETAQVREMLQLFSFESNKLELAKYAYRNTVDKRNYYSVFDVFSFSSSREELSRYIDGAR